MSTSWWVVEVPSTIPRRRISDAAVDGVVGGVVGIRFTTADHLTTLREGDFASDRCEHDGHEHAALNELIHENLSYGLL